MSQNEFERRLQRLNAQAEPEQPQSAPARARTRSERLDRALHALQERGVTGAYAYAPAFRALKAIGLGPRPLHFWSTPGLFIFGFFMVIAIGIFIIALALILGHAPRPVRVMLQTPVEVNLIVCAVLGAAFAAVHRVQANRIGLPRWRDL